MTFMFFPTLTVVYIQSLMHTIQNQKEDIYLTMADTMAK